VAQPGGLTLGFALHLVFFYIATTTLLSVCFIKPQCTVRRAASGPKHISPMHSRTKPHGVPKLSRPIFVKISQINLVVSVGPNPLCNQLNSRLTQPAVLIDTGSLRLGSLCVGRSACERKASVGRTFFVTNLPPRCLPLSRSLTVLANTHYFGWRKQSARYEVTTLMLTRFRYELTWLRVNLGTT